jgi:metal-responsive CopG/Arc/MetJ family transcriptional regulator
MNEMKQAKQGKSLLVRLSADLLRRVNQRARKEKRNRSAFIRRVLDSYISEQEDIDAQFKK